MAIIRVQATGKQLVDSSTALSFNLTGVTSGNTILVPVILFPGGGTLGASACVDGDGTYTRDIQKAEAAGNHVEVAIYRRESASAGTHAIVITPGGATNYLVAAAIEVSGLASSCFDKSSSAEGNSNSASSGATATTSTANELLVGVCQSDFGPGSLTVEVLTPTWTEEFEELNGALHAAGEADTRIVSSTGTYTANWTVGNTGPWVAAIATYKASAGGGGGGNTSDDHMGRADMNTAMREYLQSFYGVANQDVQPLIERFLKDFTNAGLTAQMKTDIALRWQYLIKCAKGQETT